MTSLRPYCSSKRGHLGAGEDGELLRVELSPGSRVRSGLIQAKRGVGRLDPLAGLFAERAGLDGKALLERRLGGFVDPDRSTTRRRNTAIAAHVPDHLLLARREQGHGRRDAAVFAFLFLCRSAARRSGRAPNVRFSTPRRALPPR
jgi:hypothetical protein